MSHATEPLLQVQDLTIHYRGQSRLALWARTPVVQAVDRVSFDLGAGETLGLVGESGCGKSSVARAIMRMVAPTAGRVLFEGQDILHLSQQKMRSVRSRMQIVLQDPASSLSPRMTVLRLVGEPLTIAGWPEREVKQRVDELLELVGLESTHSNRFAHEFSGGQRQRIAIARALALSPRLVICDEPVSALDVSVQAQIVNLLKDLQQSLAVSYLFVAHDLGVVRHISHRVAVMYLGQIVEIGSRRAVFERPSHPYTQALMSSVLRPQVGTTARRIVLKGELPSPLAPPSGCRFCSRCPIAAPICAERPPPLREIFPDHQVACHFAPEAALTRRTLPETV